jgi:4-hydroxy-2-oxoglutarate aldolase
MKDLIGIYPPIAIPFKADETIDYDGLGFNLEKWATQPLDGVVVPGSNSESAYMSSEERIEVMRVCAAAMQKVGKHFIAGTGMETTADTIRMTQVAADLGAAATLLLPPYFYKPAMDHRTLVAHFSAVADQSPIPILIYNVPQFSGVAFSAKTLIELADLPNIVGVKDSSSSVTLVTGLRAARPDFQVFAGTGSALLPFLSIGAVGGIMALANFAAKPLRAIYDTFLAGDIATAKFIQLSVAQINTAVTASYGVPGLKYAMDRTGYKGGFTRRPLLPLSEEAQRAIDEMLANLEQ